jgi:dihydrodipicolinate reductase
VAGQKLRYGQSITDACIDFSTTERVLERLARAASRRAQRAAYVIDTTGSSDTFRRGELSEWSKVLDSKSSVPARVPRVRIPRSPLKGCQN